MSTSRSIKISLDLFPNTKPFPSGFLVFFFHFAPFIVLRNLLTGQSGAGITLSENGTAAAAKVENQKKKNPRTRSIAHYVRGNYFIYFRSITSKTNRDLNIKYLFPVERAEFQAITLW